MAGAVEAGRLRQAQTGRHGVPSRWCAGPALRLLCPPALSPAPSGLPQVSWPLSIAAPEAALAQYQMVFRHIFELKWVERELTRVAAIYGQTTGLASRRARMRARRESSGSLGGGASGGAPGDVLAESLALSYSACQLMTHFFRQYLLYVTFEVMEPLWGAFERQLQTAGSLDEASGACGVGGGVVHGGLGGAAQLHVGAPTEGSCAPGGGFMHALFHCSSAARFLIRSAPARLAGRRLWSSTGPSCGA